MGSLSVLLGNGDGSFQTAVNYSSGDFGANSVALADLNGDGKTDVAVSNLGACFSPPPCEINSIGILLGKGDGSFQTAPTTVVPPLSGTVRSIAVADFNGDGKLDLALSNRRLMLGEGDGTFQDPQNYNLGTNDGVSEVVADFNGDGKPDLAVATSPFLTVLLNISTDFHQATSTALTSSRNPVDFRRHVTFTATVTSAFQGVPTGTITFSDEGHALVSVSITNGKAKFSTKSLDVGVHSITASYGGDETFLPSTSTELEQAVRAETHTRLTSSRNPSKKGQPVTFTAVVFPNDGGTPRGTVTFKDFSKVFARIQLRTGRASFTISRLREGRHVIRAEYSGSSTDGCSFAIFEQKVK
jgi:hypothetical protein